MSGGGPDLAALFGGAAFVRDAGPSFVPLGADEVHDLLTETSDELAAVSGRITGQYAEVLARFAARAFGGGADASDLEAVRTTVANLRRLSRVAGSPRQRELLDEIDALTARVVTDRSGERRRALARLQEWVPAFAETLPEEDARSLVGVLRWEKGAVPLLDELATLRGIGPRRLERLHAAGLFTVEVVGHADPDDVAAVTGIPRPLAARVVEAARRYAEAERRRCVEVLRENASRLARMVRGSPEEADGLRPQLAEILRDVNELIRAVSPEGGP